jgi:heat shock protein 4
MSVVGFDFGNDSCLIAVARSGGIDIIDNEHTYRKTPSVVSYGERQRAIGEAGKQALVTNLKNTVA